jgi:hypothetical protein
MKKNQNMLVWPKFFGQFVEVNKSHILPKEKCNKYDLTTIPCL